MELSWRAFLSFPAVLDRFWSCRTGVLPGVHVRWRLVLPLHFSPAVCVCQCPAGLTARAALLRRSFRTAPPGRGRGRRLSRPRLPSWLPGFIAPGWPWLCSRRARPGPAWLAGPCSGLGRLAPGLAGVSPCGDAPVSLSEPRTGFLRSSGWFGTFRGGPGPLGLHRGLAGGVLPGGSPAGAPVPPGMARFSSQSRVQAF